MKQLLREIVDNPLLWMLALVPILFACHRFNPESHTLLFILSVLAILPLAALLSLATEAVAARTGDAVGGLLNATLGDVTGSFCTRWNERIHRGGSRSWRSRGTNQSRS